MAQVNERIVNGVRTRVLHNKDYVEVAERLRIVHELKKEFEVVESQPYQIADRFVWRVVVRVDGKQYIGSAEAKMNAPKNSPDGTNPFECAETSALGRALAFAGLGTVESIASYEEIARGRPFETHIEPIASDRIVEAGDAPRALPQGKPPTAKEVYEKGKAKGSWTDTRGFFAFASVLLDMVVSAESRLSGEQLVQLDKAIDEPAQQSA